jgi:hypothetical protein
VRATFEHVKSERTLGMAAIGLAVVVLGMPGSALAQARPGDLKLERAREESGLRSKPHTRYGLPAGALKVSPAELVAARAGQHLRFSVVLDRRIRGATLTVVLPRRWLQRPASPLPAVRDLRLRRRAERTRLSRRDRTVALELRGGDGDVASFDIEDVGIPAGTYRLPFRWRDSSGRTRKAGVARVIFYAPAREGPEGGDPFGRLASPGQTVDPSGDAVEESETFIVVTEGDKGRIAVGSNWSSASMPAWITGDGGQTWVQRTMPQTVDKPGSSSNESGNVCCDPMFAADGLGNIWYGGLTLSHGNVPSRIVVNRIGAGTSTFQSVTTGLPVRTNGGQDKPMMTIDNTSSSPTYGRLYVVWDEPVSGGVKVVISQCDTRVSGVAQAARCDNADNWSTPASVTSSTGSYIYPDVAVGPDGRVYVTWWDYSNANSVRGDVCDPSSLNCANVSGWGTPSTMATLDATGGAPVPFACPILAQPGGRASPAPQVDVDHSGGGNNDRVYVTWSDLRPGSGSTRCNDNLAPASTHLTFDSFVASAASGALPGSASPSASVGTRLIADGEGGGQSNSDDWFAWLAVDQTNGQAWADLYSTRDFANRAKTNFYARSVTPSGGSHTLGTLTKVSSAPSDYSGAQCCNFGNDYGDYTGLAATQGIAYPVWTSNQTGNGDPFTYVAQPSPPPSQPPAVTTGAASSIGQTSATVSGTVDPNGQATTYHFEYGTTTGYGSNTANSSAGSDSSAHSVSANLTGLSPGQTYHYRLVATNATGTSQGSDQTFTTSSPPPAASPTVVTDPATGIGDTTATLNGKVNRNGSDTSWHFEYRTTASPYTSTPGDSLTTGSGDIPVSESVSGLSPGTTYFFRIAASNAGGSSTASEQSFKTAAPKSPQPPSSGSTSGTPSGSSSGSLSPNTLLQSPLQDTTAPRVGISRHSARLRRRAVRIRVRCPASEPGTCVGRVTLYTARRVRIGTRRRRLRLGSAGFRIAHGTTRRVRVPVSRAGRRLVARTGRLRVLARARARDGAGNVGKRSVVLTMLAPRR